MAMRLSTQALVAGLTALSFSAAGTAGAQTPNVSEPVVHENVAVYLLKGPSAAGPTPLTLAEALEKGSIEVSETGSVQELRIENKGAEPVFVQFGDIVKGGRQDRVLTVSLLLQGHSGVVPVGAYCVERGRWSARGQEDAKTFASSGQLMPSREAKVAIARGVSGALAAMQTQPSAPSGRSAIEAELNAVARRDATQRLAEARRAADGQGEVWRNVEALQRSLSDNLATSVASEKSKTSLQLSLENQGLEAAVAGYVSALEPAAVQDDAVTGVAVAIGGKIMSAEVYSSNALFRKMWPKLLRAAATEAIALKDKPGQPAPPADQVTAFLAAAEAGQRSEYALGSHAKVEIRQAEKVMSVRTSVPQGAFVHRNYLAN